MKPLVLECFGLPGAGKTTVLNRVISRLKERGWTVSDTTDLTDKVSSYSTVKKVYVSVRNVAPAEIASVGRVLCSSRKVGREALKRATRLPIHEAYLRLFVNRFGGEAVCLDQWTVQAIWSTTVGVSKFVPQGLSDFLKHAIAKQPRLFLYFQIDVEEAAQRIVNRSDGKSRFDGLDPLDVVRRLRNEESRMKYLYTAVQDSGAEVFRLNGSDSVESKVEDILRWIWNRANYRGCTLIECRGD